MKKIINFFKTPISFSFFSKKKSTPLEEDRDQLQNDTVSAQPEEDSNQLQNDTVSAPEDTISDVSQNTIQDELEVKQEKKRRSLMDLFKFNNVKKNNISSSLDEKKETSEPQKKSLFSNFTFLPKKKVKDISYQEKPQSDKKSLFSNFTFLPKKKVKDISYQEKPQSDKKSIFSNFNFSFKKNNDNSKDNKLKSTTSIDTETAEPKKSWLKSEVEKSNTDATNYLRKYVASKEDLIGIEISPKKIRMIQLLENEHQEWIVKNVIHKSFKNPVDMKEERATFIESLRDMITEAKFQTKNVALSLPVSSVITKTITVPLMTKEEMDNAIKYNSLWESLNQLPGASKEYSIHYEIISTDEIQSTMKILFVASKLSDLNQYTDIVYQSDLTPVIMDVKCFSNYQLLKSAVSMKHNSESFALLELGSNENYMMIESKGNPYIRDLFVSNSDKDVLNIEQKEMGMISVIIERCALQITQNLKVLNEGTEEITIDTIYLSSDSPNLNLIKHVLQEKLHNIEIIDLNPFENIHIPPSFEEIFDEDESKAAYATCVALAKKRVSVFGENNTSKMSSVNLLPNILAIQKDIKSRLYLRLGSIGMIFFSIVFGIFSVSSFAYNVFINQDELERYQNLKYEVEQFQFDYTTQLEKKENIEKSLELSDTATTNQHYAKMVIEEIAKAAGFKIALDDLSFDGYDTYVLNGQSTSDAEVINYITRIKQSDVFENVLLEKSFIDKEGSTIKSFVMKLTVKYDVIGYEKPESDEDMEGI